MSVTIYCAYDGPHAEAQTLWAERVRDHFTDGFPELRLLIFLDCIEWYELKQCARSETNRGAFFPMAGQSCESTEWPFSVKEQIFEFDDRWRMSFKFDAIIYLHGTTCASEESLTMTLAHELERTRLAPAHTHPVSLSPLPPTLDLTHTISGFSASFV